MPVTTRLPAIALFVVLTVPAYGYDVLVSVSGHLIGNTCIVSADSKEQSVPLGTIGIKQFREAGAVSNIKSAFTLKLEECGPTFTGAKIRFSGTPDELNPQLIKVADGGATGVAVQILDKDGIQVPLESQTTAYGISGDESVQMTFYARLVATGPPSIPEKCQPSPPGLRSINDAFFTAYRLAVRQYTRFCPELEIRYYALSAADDLYRPCRFRRPWQHHRLDVDRHGQRATGVLVRIYFYL